MVTLTADDAMFAVLRQAHEVSEICDARGTVIGFFAPVNLEHARDYAELAAKADPKELRRRKDSGERTHTTQEVLDRLRSPEPH